MKEPRSRKQLQPLEPGSDRTMFSASVANEVIRAVNALLMLQGARDSGLTVTVSDSNVIIDVDPQKLRDKINVTEGGGGGGNPWPVPWDSGSGYTVNDSVIRETTGDINDGTLAGTYYALQTMDAATNAAHPPGVPGSEDYWAKVARGAWGKLVFRTTGSASKKITVDVTTTQPVITVTNGARSAIIDMADLEDGDEARFREVQICQDGVTKSMKVLATVPE